MFSFRILHSEGKARVGALTTAHGDVSTPTFFPVGTAGTVKGLTPKQLRDVGAQVLLANTYHLMLRPGAETVAQLGGLHAMMAWDGPILTDSGGYQVFSLAHLRSMDDNGVVFQSHINGDEVHLTPQRAMAVQRLLGADIVMQLDECPPGRAEKAHVATAVRRSADWAAICKDAWLAANRQSASGQPQALFGIQQGGIFEDLRSESARRLVELDLPGYAVGGLSVGEGHENMCRVLDPIDEQFPTQRPRYLMGVGEPRDLLAAVLRGVDMFDCVLPTRNARNAQAFTFSGRLKLRNACWAEDTRPLEASCDCYTCQNFSRGTLRHLLIAKEMLGATLVTIHNLRFFFRWLSEIRQAIRDNQLQSRADEWLEEMYGGSKLDKC